MPPKLTEAIVLDLLRHRRTGGGNGGSGEYAFLTHVRNAAGFDANRTFDAVAISLWPSRGLTVHAFEVKVSRSDWLREVKDPAKAEAACRVAERFTVVAPAGCVKDGELPPTWGLIEVHGDGDAKPWRLRESMAAPWLRPASVEGSRRAFEPLERGFVVGLLRSCPGAIPGGKLPPPDEVAIREAHAEGRRVGKEIAAAEVEQAQQRHAELQAIVTDFELAARLSLTGFRARHDVAEIGAAVRAILDGEDRAQRAVERIAGVQRQLRDAADLLDSFVPTAVA